MTEGYIKIFAALYFWTSNEQNGRSSSCWK